MRQHRTPAARMPTTGSASRRHAPRAIVAASSWPAGRTPRRSPRKVAAPSTVVHRSTSTRARPGRPAWRCGPVRHNRSSGASAAPPRRGRGCIPLLSGSRPSATACSRSSALSPDPGRPRPVSGAGRCPGGPDVGAGAASRSNAGWNRPVRGREATVEGIEVVGDHLQGQVVIALHGQDTGSVRDGRGVLPVVSRGGAQRRDEALGLQETGSCDTDVGEIRTQGGDRLTDPHQMRAHSARWSSSACRYCRRNFPIWIMSPGEQVLSTDCRFTACR